jgi:hypothetical protein
MVAKAEGFNTSFLVFAIDHLLRFSNDLLNVDTVNHVYVLRGDIPESLTLGCLRKRLTRLNTDGLIIFW